MTRSWGSEQYSLLATRDGRNNPATACHELLIRCVRCELQTSTLVLLCQFLLVMAIDCLLLKHLLLGVSLQLGRLAGSHLLLGTLTQVSRWWGRSPLLVSWMIQIFPWLSHQIVRIGISCGNVAHISRNWQLPLLLLLIFLLSLVKILVVAVGKLLLLLVACITSLGEKSTTALILISIDVLVVWLRRWGC